ncbi:MAG: GGDEF domain-containing protein [Treponema sp.]|nr:GGDEF domain-containing protein [Treponema sp.]
MKKSDKNIGGIKIRTINILSMVASCILCSTILISSFESEHKYNSIFFDVSDYTDCTKAISDFKDATEYLTDQARLFVIHKDASFLKDYFDETNFSKRREQSLEVLALSHEDDEAMKNLTKAMKESEDLKVRELYAMKLVCEVVPLTMEELPVEITSFSLAPIDAQLSDGKKLAKAQEILFDASYINSKGRILKYATLALGSLSGTFIDQLESDDKILTKSFCIHKIICFALIVISIFIYLFIFVFVIIPLKDDMKSVKLGEKMNPKGAYELRYIANTYNELCKKNIIKETVLRHKAEHDPLTDLINREAFSQIKEIFKETNEQIAYLLIDIDYFKQINDNYGHLIGDNVLKKIAKLLSDQFRNTDYVARVGGDEFAVIMTKFGDSPEIVIQRKIDGLNKILQMVTDGLPPVSLSVGVSFSESGFKDVLEEQADKALYRVKNGGRCNCSFYDYIQLN